MSHVRTMQVLAACAAVAWLVFSGPAGAAEDRPAGKAKADQVQPSQDAAERPDEDVTARQGAGTLGAVVAKPEDAEAAEVVRVWPGGPADKAGIRPGDRIVAVDGQEVNSPEALRVQVLEHQPGDRVELTLRREGEEQKITVRLASPESYAARTPGEFLRRALSPRGWLGIRIETGGGRGVKIGNVFPESPAERSGLQAGDVIVRVDKTRVEAPADLQAAIGGREPGSGVSIVIDRDGARQTVKVQLGAFPGSPGGTTELTETEVRDLLERLLEENLPFLEELQLDLGRGRAAERKPEGRAAERKADSDAGREKELRKQIQELEQQVEALKKELSERRER